MSGNSEAPDAGALVVNGSGSTVNALRRRTAGARAASTDPNDGVIAELRKMNRLLAAYTTRGMPRGEAIAFLAAAGFAPSQIAEVLRVNPITVRTALHRARRTASGATVPADTLPSDTEPDE